MVEWQDLLLARARELENIPDSVANVTQLYSWWINEAMSTLVEGLQAEAQGIRQRGYDTLANSSKIYSLAQNGIERLRGSFESSCNFPELVQSLTVVLVGSVGRFEAEASGSDIDPDIVFSCTNDLAHSEYVHAVHMYLLNTLRERVGSPGQESGRLDIGGSRNYSYQQLSDQVARGDFSHLSNLVITGRPITNRDTYQNEIQRILSGLTADQLRDGLLAALRTLLLKDYRDLQRGESEPFDARKLMYHLMTYSMQMLCFLYISDEPLRKVRFNYWGICELLRAQPDISRLQWNRLRRGIITSMKMRNYAYELTSYDQERGKKSIQKAYVTAVRLTARRGFNVMG